MMTMDDISVTTDAYSSFSYSSSSEESLSSESCNLNIKLNASQSLNPAPWTFDSTPTKPKPPTLESRLSSLE